MHQDEDPADKKRRQARERKARWLGKQSQESLKRIREAKAASLRHHIQQLTPDQAIARRAANAASRRRHMYTAINSRSSHSAKSRKCCILQTSYTAINSRSSFSSFSRFSKMVGFNLTAATVTIHCLKLCCFIMQFDTVIGYMRKKPQHGVKRVCKFLKWSVSF